MRFLTTETIGQSRHLTPEGFLLCEAVPIARTGTQLYGPHEVPVQPGPDGLVRVERGPEDVFRPETIASYSGKPLVDDHPMVTDEESDSDFDVTPRNWRKHAVGVVMNPRRGEGILDDVLVADILVTDEEAIGKVQGGKLEISCGYTADYETLEPGRGRQVNIIGNHVALVDSGRCGSRCAIGDQDMRTRDKRTATADRKTFLDRVKAAFFSKDEKAFNDAMDDLTAMGEGEQAAAPGEGQHIHVHLNGEGPGAKDETDPPLDEEAADPNARMAAMEEAIKAIAAQVAALSAGEQAEEEAREDFDPDEEGDGDETQDEDLVTEKNQKMKEPGGTADDDLLTEKNQKMKMPGTSDSRLRVKGSKVRARDSAHLEEKFAAVMERAEILVPGIRTPTFDAKRSARDTIADVCKFRRRVLGRYADSDGSEEVLEKLFEGSVQDALPRMTCDSVAVLFNSAARVVRDARNFQQRGPGRLARDVGTTKQPTSLADVNKRNREFYKQPAR